MGKITYKIDTYRYFKYFYPDIDNKCLLDYGSNYGLFLDSSNGLFNQELYTGIDVDKEAIEEGIKLFSKAKFVHYDAYNVIYNPIGIPNHRPIFDHKFDVIISYSVVTHTTLDDFISTIDWLVSLLQDKGKLLITYLNIDHDMTKHVFTSKRIQNYGYCDEITAQDYCYLIDNKLTKEAKEGKYFLLWFKNEYLKSILKDYNYQLFDAPLDIKNCFQSCIVISK